MNGHRECCVGGYRGKVRSGLAYINRPIFSDLTCRHTYLTMMPFGYPLKSQELEPGVMHFST